MKGCKFRLSSGSVKVADQVSKIQRQPNVNWKTHCHICTHTKTLLISIILIEGKTALCVQTQTLNSPQQEHDWILGQH